MRQDVEIRSFCVVVLTLHLFFCSLQDMSAWTACGNIQGIFVISILCVSRAKTVTSALSQREKRVKQEQATYMLITFPAAY